MLNISFSKNSEGLLIPFEQGKSLANFNDPRGEALNWIYSLGACSIKHIVVVGLGAGFHVSALYDFDPTVKITVVESRRDLIPIFYSQFPELNGKIEILVASTEEDLLQSDLYKQLVSDRAFVLSYENCWGHQANLFNQFFASLTGRSLEAVKFHLEELGLDMKSYSLDLTLKNNQLLSIKELLPVFETSRLRETQKNLFRVLGELVK